MSDYRSYGHSSSRGQDYSNRSNRANPGRTPSRYGQPPRNGGRPAGRPSQPPTRRNPRRRKKVNSRIFILIILVAIIIALVVLGVKLIFPSNEDSGVTAPVNSVEPMASDPVQEVTGGDGENAASTESSEITVDQLQQMLGEEGATNVGNIGSVTVSDLSINENLPGEWMNVLLLGSDAREIDEKSRTDTMIICSINTSTGAVKLSSIMRDTAVEFTDLGDYSGTYRLNSASYFGGPELVIKTINEKLNMNIQYYVIVNFYGFQQIVESLGGVEMTITEDEMNAINDLVSDQIEEGAKYNTGGEDNLDNSLLESYGTVNLTGRQALAYSRVRSIDNDFSRSDRQRRVLNAIVDKLRGSDPVTISTAAMQLAGYISTNMNIDNIITIAYTVLSSQDLQMETQSLPVPDSYTMETRNGQSMLYDTDWDKNSVELYNFIYE